VVGQGHRQHAQELAGAAGTKASKAEPESHRAEHVGGAQALHIGWRLAVDPGHHRGKGTRLLIERGVGLGVGRRVSAQLVCRALHVGPQAQRRFLRRERGEPDFGLHQAQPAPGEAQVASDPRAQPANRIDQRRAHAGQQLAGLERAAGSLPLLENEHAQPVHCQVCGADEPVVSAADHDDVVAATAAGSRAFAGHAAGLTLRSTCRAAMRPGAPMIPPPG
jgi:hypothetical protein